MGRHRADLPADIIAGLYHGEGWDQRAIAGLYGVSQATIRNVMIRAGISTERRTPGRLSESRRRACAAGGHSRARRLSAKQRTEIAKRGGYARWRPSDRDAWTLECRLCGHVELIKPERKGSDAWPRVELQWVAHATADHGLTETQARCLLVVGEEAEWWRPGETPDFRGASLAIANG